MTHCIEKNMSGTVNLSKTFCWNDHNNKYATILKIWKYCFYVYKCFIYMYMYHIYT